MFFFGVFFSIAHILFSFYTTFVFSSIFIVETRDIENFVYLDIYIQFQTGYYV